MIDTKRFVKAMVELDDGTWPAIFDTKTWAAAPFETRDTRDSWFTKDRVIDPHPEGFLTWLPSSQILNVSYE